MASIENDSRYRAAVLAAYLARHYPDAAPHRIARVVFEMQSAARAAVAFGVKCCNVPMDEKQTERGRARIQKLAASVNASLADIAAPHINPGKDWLSTIKLGDDPRGACGWLMIPGESGDGFGDGFAIY